MKKTKIASGILLGLLLASRPLDAANNNCKAPVETNDCSGNQTANCWNGCLKITAESKKNKDCNGAPGAKVCAGTLLELGGTAIGYQALGQNGQNSTVSNPCATCSTTVIVPSYAIAFNCRDAALTATNCDSTGTGTGNRP
jgi:hypothetical protein